MSELFNKAEKINININGKHVYYLLDGDEVVYVGISSNVMHRIGTHKSSKDKYFDSFMVVEIPDDEDIELIEFFEITKFQPKYNSSQVSGNIGFKRLESYRRDVSLGEPNLTQLKKAVTRYYDGLPPSIHGVNFYTYDEIKNCLRSFYGEKK